MYYELTIEETYQRTSFSPVRRNTAWSRTCSDVEKLNQEIRGCIKDLERLGTVTSMSKKVLPSGGIDCLVEIEKKRGVGFLRRLIQIRPRATKKVVTNLV